MNNAKQRVALVTGVSSGIGRATAQLLAARGWRTFGTMRKPAGDLPGVELLPLDVRDAASVEACVNAVLSTAGRIDVLINNAGVGMRGSLEETSIDEARALFETDFFGVMRVTNAVLPTMRAQRSGQIVTIGSAAGFVGIPFQGAYVAAKHAVEGWAETLAYELDPFGIRVALIEPSWIRTEIGTNASRAHAAIPDYANDRRRAEAGIERNIAQGEEPSVVAATVWEAITSPRPRLRYLAGKGAKRVRMLRSLLPQRLFAVGLRHSTFAD